MQKQFTLLFALMLSAISFFTCKITERKPVPAPPGFDWQGHRGCRGLLPENSIPGFLKALEFPQVQTLELDLAVSADKQLIVSHEPWFNPAICRQPDGSEISKNDETRFLIYSLSAEAIRGFDCGSAGNPRFPEQQPMMTYKPTLREVVEAVREAWPGKTVRWNIEIKSQPEWDGLRTPPVQEFAELVAAELRNLGLENLAVVQSFDVRPLQVLHDLNPKLHLALLIENTQGFEANLERLGFTPFAYSPYYLLVDAKLVRRCKQKNIRLIPWTVNDVPAMRRLVRLGVDGIITDYPNLIAVATGE